MKIQPNYLYISFGFFLVASLQLFALPEFSNPTCSVEKDNIKSPAEPASTILFSHDCKTIYVGPPQFGTVGFILKSTPITDFCPDINDEAIEQNIKIDKLFQKTLDLVESKSREIDKLRDQEAKILSQVEELKSEWTLVKAYSYQRELDLKRDLISDTKTNLDKQQAALSELKQSIARDDELLKKLIEQEAYYAYVIYEVHWNELIEQYRKLNAHRFDLRFEKLPVISQRIDAAQQVDIKRSVDKNPIIFRKHLSSVRRLGIGPDTFLGHISLSLNQVCGILRDNSLHAGESIPDMALTALSVANVSYDYYSSAQLYRAEFRYGLCDDHSSWEGSWTLTEGDSENRLLPNEALALALKKNIVAEATHARKHYGSLCHGERWVQKAKIKNTIRGDRIILTFKKVERADEKL